MNPLTPWLWIYVWPALHADSRDAAVARDERVVALVRELGNDEHYEPAHFRDPLHPQRKIIALRKEFEGLD